MFDHPPSGEAGKDGSWNARQWREEALINDIDHCTEQNRIWNAHERDERHDYKSKTLNSDCKD